MFLMWSIPLHFWLQESTGIHLYCQVHAVARRKKPEREQSTSVVGFSATKPPRQMSSTRLFQLLVAWVMSKELLVLYMRFLLHVSRSEAKPGKEHCVLRGSLSTVLKIDTCDFEKAKSSSLFPQGKVLPAWSHRSSSLYTGSFHRGQSGSAVFFLQCTAVHVAFP